MKAKPRWMQSVIETAEKYANSVSAQNAQDATKPAPRPDLSDQS